jgi:type VI protein secretion system component VasF
MASEPNTARNRKIADNEEQRQVTGNIRVSAWAIAVAVVLVAIVVWTGWGWLHH